MNALLKRLCGPPPDKDGPNYKVESLQYTRRIMIRFYGPWFIVLIAVVLIEMPIYFLIAPALLLALWVRLMRRLDQQIREAQPQESFGFTGPHA